MYEIVFSDLNGAFFNPLPFPVIPARADLYFLNAKLTAMNGWVPIGF